MKQGFIQDSFLQSRGGCSQMLDIFCASCQQYIATYQKDGVGTLKRLYLDRLHGTDGAAIETISPELTTLACPCCSEAIGTHGIYKKENRPIIRLYQNSIETRVVDAFSCPVS